MSEITPFNNYEVIEADRRRTSDLHRLVGRIISERRASDPVEHEMLRTVYSEFDVNGRIGQLFTDSFAFKRTTGSFFPNGYALRAFEFGVDKQIRQNIPDSIYPRILVVPPLTTNPLRNMAFLTFWITMIYLLICKITFAVIFSSAMRFLSCFVMFLKIDGTTPQQLLILVLTWGLV
jgi:hypothetical protein